MQRSLEKMKPFEEVLLELGYTCAGLGHTDFSLLYTQGEITIEVTDDGWSTDGGEGTTPQSLEDFVCLI